MASLRVAVIVIRFLFVILFLFSIKSQAEQLGFSLVTTVASPAVELSKLRDDWVVSGTGTYAYAKGRLDSWFEVNSRWRIGITKRADYLFEFSPETAQFYSRLEQNTIPAGRYDLDLKVNGLMSQGVYLEHLLDIATQGKLRVRLHGLQGSIVQFGSLSGSGEVFENGTFEYDYGLDYHFDHSRILDSNDESVSGFGYAVDLRLEYGLGRHWALRGSIDDLVYRIHWNKINRDRGCVSSPASPVCRGRTDVVSKSQSIQSQSDWMVYGLKGRLRPYVRWQSWGRRESWILGGLYENYSAGWDFENEVVNFTYDSDRLQVEWAFDNINAADGNHWQITLGTIWPIF